MFAPAELSVTLLPVQMDVLEALAVTVGRGSTVIVLVAVPVQPAAEVPVTVYVVVTVGVTTTGLPDMDPGIQVYVDAPLAVIVLLEPAQIFPAGVAVVVTVGFGFTVTVSVAVLEHPGPVDPVTV